jgi:hypothetical protein
VEALIALDRYADAEAILRQLALDRSDDPDLLVFPFLQASAHLAQGKPGPAAAVLSDRAARDRENSRQVAWAARLTAMLGAAAQGLGQHETAAILFGHSDGVQERLGVRLRRFDHLLVDGPIADCRAALGDDRFAELAAQGAQLDFRDLPRVLTGTSE